MLVVSTQTETDRTPVWDEEGNPVFDEDGEMKFEETDKYHNTWMLVRSDTIVFGSRMGYNGTNGAFVGVSVGQSSGGENTIRSVVELTAVRNVAPTDFFERNGLHYVTAGGKTYQVSDQVECYRKITDDRFSEDNWLQQSTGEARLEACKAFSDHLTLYIDPVGGQVRIIAVK